MYYSEAEARQLVVEAGHRLLENGLIARTWGNISARISDTHFIITPSGLAYETMKPEQLVKVLVQVKEKELEPVRLVKELEMPVKALVQTVKLRWKMKKYLRI